MPLRTKPRHRTTPDEFRSMVETLIGLLAEEERVTDRLARLVRTRLEAEMRGDLGTREDCFEIGREILTDLVLVERERIAALVEIGLVLGHRRPSSLRLAELALYVDPDRRARLLAARDSLIRVADELDLLYQAGARKLSLRTEGRVAIFSEPSKQGDAAPTRDLEDRLRDLERDLLTGTPNSGVVACAALTDDEEDDDPFGLDSLTAPHDLADLEAFDPELEDLEALEDLDEFDDLAGFESDPVALGLFHDADGDLVDDFDGGVFDDDTLLEIARDPEDDDLGGDSPRDELLSP